MLRVYGSAQDRSVCISVVAADTAIAVAQGTVAFVVPASMDGMSLSDVIASITSTTLGAGTLTTKCQVRKINVADSSEDDMLSTEVTIDPGEQSSLTAAAAFVVDSATSQVLKGDGILVDIDQIPETTDPEGLAVVLSFD